MISTYELVQIFTPLEPPKNFYLGWFKITNRWTSAPSVTWNWLCQAAGMKSEVMAGAVFTKLPPLEASRSLSWWVGCSWDGDSWRRWCIKSIFGTDFLVRVLMVIFLYSRRRTEWNQILWWWFITCRWRYKTMDTCPRDLHYVWLWSH